MVESLEVESWVVKSCNDSIPKRVMSWWFKTTKLSRVPCSVES